jgi:hypothetical protein
MPIPPVFTSISDCDEVKYVPCFNASMPPLTIIVEIFIVAEEPETAEANEIVRH